MRSGGSVAFLFAVVFQFLAALMGRRIAPKKERKNACVTHMRDYIYVTQYILTKQKCEYIHMCTGGLCCVCVVWCVATGTPLFHHRQGSHRAHHRSLNVHKLEIFKAQPSQSFPIKKPFGPCTPVRLQK